MANPKIYYRPQTLVEAIERAAQPGTIALAGGALAFGTLTLPYEAVVDLQDIDAIKQIEVIDGALRIGGAVTLAQVVESSLVPLAVKQALTRVISPNIRNNTSVGETLMLLDSATLPLREWLAVLRVMDASVEYAGQDSAAPTSLWLQSLEEFVQFLHERGGYFEGLIAYLSIPLLADGAAVGSAFVARTPADVPIVNAATWVILGDDGLVVNAGAAVCGASTLPVLFLDLKGLDGNPLDETTIANVVKSIPVQVNPVDDYLGSADYRREMARICVQRALVECMRQL